MLLNILPSLYLATVKDIASFSQLPTYIALDVSILGDDKIQLGLAKSIFEYVLSAIKAKKNVIIYDGMGHNQAVAMVIALVGKITKKSLKESLAIVWEKYQGFFIHPAWIRFLKRIFFTFRIKSCYSCRNCKKTALWAGTCLSTSHTVSYLHGVCEKYK